MVRVMVAGAFDFLHPGHLDLFRQAKKHGDELVVVVARDASVEKTKGKKPVFSENERLEVVQSVRFVDRAVLGGMGHWFDVLLDVKPDVLLLGYDQKVDETALAAFLAKRGLKTKILRAKSFEAHKFKSSKLKEHLGI
ncbi:FAD synthase [Candidatus Micrarchaeota archaeon]|nr:FAD synthase [Candidatus Micrarchaeota archaeon]